MPLISLYGYIDNPNCPEEGEALYILREIKESDTLYKYEGRIGYGWHEGDFSSVPPTTVMDSADGSLREVNDIEVRVKTEPGFPVKYIPTDMRDFSFTYDIEKLQATVTCDWRMQYHPAEAKSLKNNVVLEQPDRDDDAADSYAYFRYPRSKDGIAVSRVFDKIFEGKNVTVFLPKSN
jgi:hypothetical protein